MPGRLQRSFQTPPEAGTDLSGFWILHHGLLQLGIFILIEIRRTDSFECGRFDEREHHGIIRQWRTARRAPSGPACLARGHINVRVERRAATDACEPRAAYRRVRSPTRS